MSAIVLSISIKCENEENAQWLKAIQERDTLREALKAARDAMKAAHSIYIHRGDITQTIEPAISQIDKVLGVEG